MIELKNLTVSTADKTILKNLSYRFEKGKIYAVMGPNGSGKSTLAYALLGHPGYSVDENSQILFDGRDIRDDKPEDRAKQGMFLSFQSPLALSGVKVRQLLQLALQGNKDPLTIRKEIQQYAKDLRISEELLERSLNDGASGGEKKKMEVLQAAVLDKKLQIFDEVDTGVDVDSLKSIAEFLARQKSHKTYIIITHYNRILHYLRPDKVLVLMDGQLKKEGDYTLAERIERDGYEKATA